MDDYQDPGWRSALRGVGWLVFPMPHVWLSRTRPAENGLISLRRIYLSLVDALFLFLVAFTFIAPWDGGNEGWIPTVVVALGAYSLVAVIHLSRRPLNTESPERLAGSYRARFIGVGMAEAAALFGICGIFIGGSLWIYLVGLPFALAGLAIIAPTRANIERSQQKVQASGSPLSLGAALLKPVEPVDSPAGIRALRGTRLRMTAYVIFIVVALIGFGIQALRPSFDPEVIVLPAFCLFIGAAVVTVSMSIARSLAARRRPPPGPPTA